MVNIRIEMFDRTNYLMLASWCVVIWTMYLHLLSGDRTYVCNTSTKTSRLHRLRSRIPTAPKTNNLQITNDTTFIILVGTEGGIQNCALAVFITSIQICIQVIHRNIYQQYSKHHPVFISETSKNFAFILSISNEFGVSIVSWSEHVDISSILDTNSGPPK